MGMKPVMNEPFGTVMGATTQPSKKGHYEGVANTTTTMKETGNPNPGGIPSTTTTKGPVPKA